jgi:hypothetical protein
MSKDAELKAYLSSDRFSVTAAVSMIRNGAHPNTVNNNGDNLLHLIIKSIDINPGANVLLPEILRLKGNIEQANAAGLSPLQCLMMQKSINFDAIFHLINAGANVLTVDSKGNSLIHHAVFTNNLTNLCRVIKLGANVNTLNHAGQLPLFNLLQQEPVNWDAVAVLVFAGADLIGRGRIPVIEHEHVIDTVNGSLLSMPYINPEAPRILGQHMGSKEKVMAYIKTLPIGMQQELVDSALDKESSLGVFFRVKRGAFAPDELSGTLKQLRVMKEQLNKDIPVTSVRIEQCSYFSLPPLPFTPSAPPYDVLSAVPPRPASYNPAMFGAAPTPTSDGTSLSYPYPYPYQ